MMWTSSFILTFPSPGSGLVVCASVVLMSISWLRWLQGTVALLRASCGGFQGSCGAREEAEQRSVDLLGVRPADVVRATLDRHDGHVRDELAESCGRSLE